MPCLKAFSASFRSFLEGVQLAVPALPGGQGASTWAGGSVHKAPLTEKIANIAATSACRAELEHSQDLDFILERLHCRTARHRQLQDCLPSERSRLGTLRDFAGQMWKL